MSLSDFQPDQFGFYVEKWFNSTVGAQANLLQSPRNDVFWDLTLTTWFKLKIGLKWKCVSLWDQTLYDIKIKEDWSLKAICKVENKEGCHVIKVLKK